MARKRRKRQSNDLQGLWEGLAVLFRPEVVGLTLVLIAVFTLLSLLTGSRGRVTGFWIDFLQSLTGEGIWGIPLLTGVLGLWMVIRAIEKMPDLPWQKPAGLLLIFLAYITGVTLWVPIFTRSALAEAGGMGGLLGLTLANLLQAAFSLGGAWAIVTFMALTGLILLTDRLLIDAALDTWDAVQDVWADWQAGREEQPPALQPDLPLPQGDLPWWKRLLGRVLKSRQEPPVIGRQGTARAPDQNHAAVTGSAEPATSTRGGTTPPSEDTTLTPRIVGGRQEWRLPNVANVLDSWERFVDDDDHIRQQGRLIQDTLALFGVPADFEGAYKGPAVTQYLIKPGYIERKVRGEVKKTKVKVSKISALANDLALALAAPNVRIEAPIPGTNYVGVEVPNKEGNVVGLRELMESDVFETMREKGKMAIALGEDVKGQPIITDLVRMPHLLIAGATGSGKSVCINGIIADLLLTHTPDTLRFLMIDPKMVELNVYNGIPHLLSPVVTEVDRAAGVLFWAVKEMERRYQLLNKANARDLSRYNAKLRKEGEQPLPYIVIIVDEMADLMMAAPEEVEKHVCRLAQMSRAVGLHLIIATQRPSVDVITGLIKANFPARIAFAVTSQVDSRVILDVPGAERLLGRGDMLFMAPDASKLERLQGTFVSDEEINRLVRYWKGIRSFETYTDPEPPDADDASPVPPLQPPEPAPPAIADWEDPYNEVAGEDTAQPDPTQPALFEQIEELKAVDARDDLFDDAVHVVEAAGRGSVTLLQRKLRIGYNRASRLVSQLERAGVLGPDQGGNQGRAVYPQEHQPSPSKSDASDRPDAAGSIAPRIIGDDDEDAPDSPPQIWM